MSEPQDTVDIHHQHLAGYQTYHADGALGGMTPQGNIYLGFYLERGAIPDYLKMQVAEDGRTAAAVEARGRKGIVRELNCGIVMSVSVALALKDYLGRMIEDANPNKSTGQSA